MRPEMKKLTDAELDLMLAIWAAGEPVQRAYLDEAMREAHNWADTTILTLLSKLIDKGYLTCEKQGKRNVYTPRISQADYRAYANRNFLGKMYGNSFLNFTAAMFHSNDITPEELEELEALLKEAKQNGKHA